MNQEAKGANLSPTSFAKKRADDALFGFKIRSKLFPGEDQFFKERPEVAGMAAGDGMIVLNPYSSLSKIELGQVAKNEALRLKMYKDEFDPDIEITNSQREFFRGTEYEKNPTAMKQTILARIYSQDPSAMATKAQKDVLSKYLSSEKVKQIESK
jgi:hypothetical protein